LYRNFILAPLTEGSVQIRQSVVNIKNKDLTQQHRAILTRLEHYVNGAHIQLERIKKDIELMGRSSPFEDGWDIGLWCQMLDAHYLAISVNIAANLAKSLADEFVLIDSIWSDIITKYRCIENESLHPLRDALEHMDERLRGSEKKTPIPPKPAALEIQVDEKGVIFFVWGDEKQNLQMMVDDITTIYEDIIHIFVG